MNQIVRNVQQMEMDLRGAIRRIQNGRKIYIQFNHIHCKKANVKISDAEVARRANEIGLTICSITNRSVTLRARDYGSYAWAKAWFIS